MSIAITFKKIKRNLNDFGIKRVFIKSVKYLLKTIYVNRTYRVYRRNLAADNFPVKVPDGVVIKVISNDDVGSMGQIEEMEEWLQGKLSGIMSHGICIAAFEGSTVVGFNLVAFQEVFIPLLNLKKRIRSKHAWSEQITVLKTYRKQGLASALRYHIFAELQKRGIHTLYGGTLISNIPAQKLACKIGFQFIADVKYLKILNRERRIWKRIKHVGH
jgi:GNAT superfamily N-acetyltransferase